MKKSKIIVFIVILAVVIALGFILTRGNDKTAVERIQERGKLIVGTEGCAQNLNYRDLDGNFSGLEIEIAKGLAKEILGDENAIEYKIITATDRPIMLDSGEVDIVLSTYSVTKERLEATDFSYPYFNDNTGFIVLKNSGIKSFEDLNGKKIGLLQSTATIEALGAVAKEKGYNIEFPQYTSYGDLKAALSAGRIDAFSSDKSILQSYLDDDTIILDDSYGMEPYGVGIKQGSDLLDVVNKCIKEWVEDGTIDKWTAEHHLPVMDWNKIDQIAKDLGLIQ